MLDIPFHGYDGLDYDRDELCAAMRKTYDQIIDFVTTDAFRAMMDEMGRLPGHLRPAFVVDNLLNDAALEERGIHRPADVMIQRSAFGDRRPTLFVVKKWLPEKYKNVWENVNITFDNEYADASVARDPETSWRMPLPVDYQASLMAEGRDLETL